MKLAIQKATTNVTCYIFIQDSSATTGVGLAGLTFDSSGLTASQVRPLAVRLAVTLATQTVTGAHTDGGFVEIDATNMPGVYRLDLPDAVCATGVDSVVVFLHGATNMAPVTLEIQLVSYDPNDAVRMGQTALPNAAADAAGGLPISDAGGLDLDTQLDAAISSRATPAQVNTEVVDALATDVIADSVPADGSLPTIEQAIYMILQMLYERSVSGTTVTVRKVDGSTSLLTLTLDDGTKPTSITRAT